MGNDDGSVEVVVHSLLALLGEAFHVDCRRFSRFQLIETLPAVHYALIRLLGSLQSLVGEVDSAAIVSLENEETDCHGRICLHKSLVCACEELVEGDEVAQRLAHLLPVDGNHVVVHPVAHGVVT